jgi:hypothetical protein
MKAQQNSASQIRVVHIGNTCTYNNYGSYCCRGTPPTSSVIADDVARIPDIHCDPVINDWCRDKLFANVDTDDNIDYARISAVPRHGGGGHDHGHGLGFGGDCHKQHDAKRGGHGSCPHYNGPSVTDQAYAIFVR